MSYKNREKKCTNDSLLRNKSKKLVVKYQDNVETDRHHFLKNEKKIKLNVRAFYLF